MKRCNAAVNSGRRQTEVDGARSCMPIRRGLFGALRGVPSTARRGWASSRSLEGKRSAQRHPARRRQRWKPKGRDAIGGLMRSTTAWPGIAGDARWTFNAGAQGFVEPEMYRCQNS